MTIARFIAMLIIAFSVALAGVPAQANASCPMAKHAAGQTAATGPSCHKTAPQKALKDGCCDDEACKAKCSAWSGVASVALPDVEKAPAAFGEIARRMEVIDDALMPQLLTSQERPPKSLA